MEQRDKISGRVGQPHCSSNLAMVAHTSKLNIPAAALFSVSAQLNWVPSDAVYAILELKQTRGKKNNNNEYNEKNQDSVHRKEDAKITYTC
jgi:hypothetical protein